MFKWMIGPYRINEYSDGYRNRDYDAIAYGSSKETYFYLVVDSNKAPSVSDEDVQSFYKMGINSGESYVFVVVDIATDNRLKDDLLTKFGSRETFKEIQEKSPVFIITNGPINSPNPFLVLQMNLVKIDNFSQDIEVVFEKMGLPLNKSRKVAINFLRKINKWLELKANAAGLGVNFNAMIDDAINSLEERIP